MGWKVARHLILPTALTVSTFAVVLACGGDDEETSKTPQSAGKCADLSGCQLCEDDTGKVTCGPSSDCFKGTDGYCHPGGSS